MSEPSSKLFYRILPNGEGWYWELIDRALGVVERGIADDDTRACKEVFSAAFERRRAVPAPYADSKTCLDATVP